MITPKITSAHGSCRSRMPLMWRKPEDRAKIW